MRADHELLQRLAPEHLPAASYPCPYLSGRTATARAFAAERLPGELYHDLMDRGFRRSGQMFYAMDCDGCRACMPLRVPVATFAPSRSQRRTWRRNQDLRVEFATPRFAPHKFAMFRRYLRDQHADSPSETTEEGFRQEFYGAVVDSVEASYLLGDQLLAISLLDVCSRSVSAVYHFYEPEHRRRRLGVFSALAEIEYARRLGAPHYYLGYWVRGAATMHYKAEYGPHQLLRDGDWTPGAAGDDG
ncbi:MAG: arginyltransferase [Planctomycetota bacterium]